MVMRRLFKLASFMSDKTDWLFFSALVNYLWDRAPGWAVESPMTWRENYRWCKNDRDEERRGG